MNPKTVKSLGLGLVILVCAYFLFRQTTGQRPELPATVGQGVAHAAYDETLAMLEGKGSIAVVHFTCDSCPQETEMQETYLRLVEKNRGIELLGTETVPLTDFPVLPSEVYAKLVKAYPEADAVISLVGLPRGRPPETGAQLLAVVLNGDRLYARKLFEMGLLDRAILPRSTRPEGVTSEPETPAEQFAYNYEVITPDLASAIVD